jgi:hypothetical protein
MPFPYFSMPTMPSKNFEPIYSNLFEFVLVTENYHMKELTYELSYVNTIDKNKINISFLIDTSHFKHLNFDNFLKDIKYVIHVTHDKSGNILNQFLISVKFINSEINFSHSDSKILEVKLELDNISSEEINVPVCDAYIKSLQRNYKLEKLI